MTGAEQQVTDRAKPFEGAVLSVGVGVAVTGDGDGERYPIKNKA